MPRALRSKRGFGVFWLGFSGSVLGDAITRTTLIWYVFERTGSPVSAGFAVPVLGVRAAIAGIALITSAVGGLGLMIAELRHAR